MLVNIVDGKPEGYLTLTEAAKKFGVMEQSVRNWCKRGYFNDSDVLFIRNSSQIAAYYISETASRPIFANHRGENLKKKPSPYDYATNVLNNVAKYYSIPEGEYVSSDRLENIVEDVLVERDRTILKALYADNMTLLEVGKILGITSERVRQIKLRALRKIGHRITVEKYRRELEDKRYLITNGGLDELDLSVRAWNCLLRSNVNTLDELLAMTPDQIIRIRNLGRKTYQEIIDKVHEHGYKFNWEE